MSSMPSLREYYKSFGFVKGAFTAIGVLSPILAIKLSGTASTHFMFPPIGDLAPLAASMSMALTLASTTYGYFKMASGNRITAGPIVVLAATCALMYLGLSSSFVVKIDDPASQTEEYVTIGYQRSAFASSNFAGMDDEDMIQHRGTSDPELNRLWTRPSLVIVRLALVASCTCFFVTLGAFWSALVAVSLISGPKPAA